MCYSAKPLCVHPAQWCEPEPWGAGQRSESAAANQHDAIKAFVQGTVAEAAPVVPISAQLKYNIDAVCEYIVKKVAGRAFHEFTSYPHTASMPPKPLHAWSNLEQFAFFKACMCQLVPMHYVGAKAVAWSAGAGAGARLCVAAADDRHPLV